MSLDISLTATVEATVVDKNITHNVSNMWKKAGIYEALYNSAGKTSKEILPILEKGLKDMKEKPDEYKKLDAPNGWGTYEQALSWLDKLIEEFKEYPDGEIWISK